MPSSNMGVLPEKRRYIEQDDAYQPRQKKVQRVAFLLPNEASASCKSLVPADECDANSYSDDDCSMYSNDSGQGPSNLDYRLRHLGSTSSLKNWSPPQAVHPDYWGYWEGAHPLELRKETEKRARFVSSDDSRSGELVRTRTRTGKVGRILRRLEEFCENVLGTCAIALFMLYFIQVVVRPSSRFDVNTM